MDDNKHINTDFTDPLEMQAAHRGLLGAILIVAAVVFFVLVAAIYGAAAIGQDELAAPLVYEVADSDLAQIEAKLLLYTGEVPDLTDDRIARLDAIADYLLEQPAPVVPDELKVNLNTGSLVELMSLAGIGKAKGEDIIASREKDGPFVDWRDAMTRRIGIGPATYQDLIEEGRAYIE